MYTEEMISVDNKLTDIQDLLNEYKIIICFSGQFSQGIIEELGEAVKKYMEFEDKPKNNIHNVFSIFIEQSQNIKKYSAKKIGLKSYDMISTSAIICIGKTEDGYFIRSGNLMEKGDITNLKKSLDNVIGKSKEDLKAMYKEQLKKELSLDASGAGMGFIDIARKSNGSIQYSIKDVNDNYSFYEIMVIV